MGKTIQSGQGNAGGWPSTTGKKSGGGRSNNSSGGAKSSGSGKLGGGYKNLSMEVFISYSWQAESNKVADEIEEILISKNYKVIRDKTQLGYKGLIKEFMDKLAKGSFIIIIISDSYLKSENCMYELLQITQENFYDRIFPLVLPDTKIYKASDRIKFVHYWEKEIKELEISIKKGTLTNLQGIFSDLNLYSEIRRNIDKITTILKNINMRSITLQQKNDYSPLIDMLEKKSKDISGINTQNSDNEIDHFYLFLKRTLTNLSDKKINSIKKIFEENDTYSLIFNNQKLNSITHDEAKSIDIVDFYKHLNSYSNFKSFLNSHFYLSTSKLNRFYNIHKLSFDKENKLGDNISNEEKIIRLFDFYQKNNILVFLAEDLMDSSNIPISTEPIICFHGHFHLKDNIEEHFTEFDTSYSKDNPMPISVAHLVLEYPDPMVYPILQFEYKKGETTYILEVSRKYIPFTSGKTDYLVKLLSGFPITITGYGSIEQIVSKTYKLQPIILK